jgi:hypothetical protein
VRVTLLESRSEKRKFLWQVTGIQKFYVQLIPFSVVLSLTVANYRLLITFVNTMLLATHYVCMSVIMYVGLCMCICSYVVYVLVYVQYVCVCIVVCVYMYVC